MGIPDALMLMCLGIGHFMHAIKPIKKPITSLWVAMMFCGIVYGIITSCMGLKPLANIYVLSVLMCINGYLQSFSWPNLLMLIHSKFKP
jgi:sugar phosphate permease